MASSNSSRLSEFLPMLAFGAAWSLQLAYFLNYDSRVFFTYDFSVLPVLLLAIASYTMGFLGQKFVPRAGTSRRRERVVEPIDAQVAKTLMRLTIALSLTVVIINVILPVASGVSLSGAREIALESWEEGGLLVRAMAIVVNITIAFSIMTIIDRIDATGKFPFVLVLMFIALTIAAYSRAHLLLGLSIISTKWISQSKYRMSYIFLVFVLFAGLFSILSVIASVGSANRAGGIEDVYRSLEVYTFGGVAGFEFFYTTGIPQYRAILTLPRFIYSIFPNIGTPPPSYFPFVDTNPPINVFSALYPPFHDFGRYGIVIFFWLYGFISATAAYAFQIRRGRHLCVITGFLLYAALMSPFDDQYIRGLTILILLLAGITIYSLLYRGLHNARWQVR